MLAALVTPPDVITQLILFVVVYGLYEVSIFLVARTEKQINEQFADDDYSQDTDNDFDDPLIKDFDEKNRLNGVKSFKCPNTISKIKVSLAQIAEAMKE